MERALASSRDCQPVSPVNKRRIRSDDHDDRPSLAQLADGRKHDAFELAAVAGTAQTQRRAQSVRVDTILLDLEMPGAGGLRSDPANPR